MDSKETKDEKRKVKKAKILITGSAGYIGSSFRARFRGRFSFINFDIAENKKNDVRDFERVKRAVRNADGVLHFAAVSRPKWGFEDPYRCLTTNVLGTVNVLEAVRQINPRAWVILGSSREVFGNVKKFPATEATPRSPLNAYAVSKVAGEDLLRQYAANYGLRCLALRFCGVYTGAKDILDRVIPRFILQALQGVPITIEGQGIERFDFVFIDDALDGIFRAIRFLSVKPKGFYDDVTLAHYEPVSLYALAQLIIRFSRSRSAIQFVRTRSYDQKGFWASFAKAKKTLGWIPKFSLEKGLQKAIEELKPIAQRSGFIE